MSGINLTISPERAKAHTLTGLKKKYVLFT